MNPVGQHALLTTSGRAPDDSGDGALQGQALYHGSSELPECRDWRKDTHHCSSTHRGSKGPTVFPFDLSTPPSSGSC